MSKKLKKLLTRIAVAACLFIAGMLLSGKIAIIFLVAAYVTAGYDVVKKAVRNIGHGQVFDENFLMTIATIGAFVTGEIAEGVMVMLLYQIGEWFQQYAVGKSRNSITELMDIRPDYANALRDGEIETVDPDEVEIGETILVKPGEKVPIDGVVTKGESYVDTSALTGEAIPKRVAEGDEVLSGFINDNGLLEIKTTKEFDESTVSKILELVENASSRKAKSENFITKFAKYYTPIVVVGALLLAFLPTILGSNLGLDQWIIRACTFLVISCPCALVISVPLGFFGGIGGAAKEGILIKGSNYMETLANIRTVVFDKTGTLTEGTFKVNKIASLGESEDKILELAAIAESYSNHPIAVSLRMAYGKDIDGSNLSDVCESKGMGVSCSIDGQRIYVGNQKLLREKEIDIPVVDEIGTVVYVAKDNKCIGYIIIADEIKEDAKSLVEALKMQGIKTTVMLTGDKKEIAEKVAASIGIDKVCSELLPQEKVSNLEKLLEEEKGKGSLAFVGDGINDAPVLTRADIGFAMGAMGSDAAIEAADVVIMNDQPSKIADAIKVSKKTIAIVKENIIFALGVKILFLLLGALGMINLWMAVFADVGVAFLAILNSMRALKK